MKPTEAGEGRKTRSDAGSSTAEQQLKKGKKHKHMRVKSGSMSGSTGREVFEGSWVYKLIYMRVPGLLQIILRVPGLCESNFEGSWVYFRVYVHKIC